MLISFTQESVHAMRAGNWPKRGSGHVAGKMGESSEFPRNSTEFRLACIHHEGHYEHMRMRDVQYSSCSIRVGRSNRGILSQGYVSLSTLIRIYVNQCIRMQLL